LVGTSVYIQGSKQSNDIDWEARERRAAAARAERERERLGRSLTKERHETYTKWQDNQRLSHRDREGLARRGLSPESIQLAQDMGWLRRWDPQSTFPGKANIPGWKPDGLRGQDGMAIAAPNVDGLIAGFQISPYVIIDETKYWWVPDCHLRCDTDELPMPIFRHPDYNGPVQIWIVEGFLKSLITALLAWEAGYHDVVVVGCGGSYWASHEVQWRYTLFRLKRVGITDCYFLPDAGVPHNEGIRGQFESLKKFLTELEQPIQVKFWGQWIKKDKGRMDPDEVPTQTVIDAKVLENIPNPDLHYTNPYAIELWRKSPQRRGHLSCLTPGIGVPEVIKPEEFGDRVVELAGLGIDILYRPDMGTGKTHTAALEAANLPPGYQGVYSGTQYKNSLTPTVGQLPILPVKHGWLIRETLKDGTVRIRNSRQGETPEKTKGDGIEWLEPNCPKAEAYHAAYAAGLTISAGKDSPLCQTCDRAEITYGSDGEIVALTCPYLKERAEVAQLPAYRCHPSSIATPKEEHHQINFIDEADQVINPVSSRSFGSLNVARELQSIKDFSRTKTGMLRHTGEILEPIFDRLQGLLATTAATEEHHYGIGALDLRKALLPAINETVAIHNRIAQDIGTADWTNATEGLKWMAKQCDRLLATDINRELVDAHNLKHQLNTINQITGSRFAGDLLRALVNPNRKQLATIDRCVITDPKTKRAEVISSLKISKRDHHSRSVLDHSDRTNVYLDATATRDLRLKTAGRPLWQLTLPKPDYSNLTIQGITGTDGYFTNRTTDVQDRAAEFVGTIASLLEKLGVIDYRRFHRSYEKIDGVTCLARFAESRGENRLENHNDLLIMGKPIQNLGALAVEYTITTGQLVSPNDPDPQFRAWIERKSQAAAIQEGGRIRAHRSPNEQKTIRIAGAGPATMAAFQSYFPTATTQTIDIMAIAPQASGSQGLRTANRVLDKAIGHLQNLAVAGVEKLPTVEELAATCGTSTNTLKRAVRKVMPNGGPAEFMKRANSLLNTQYRELAQFPDPELESLRQELDAIGTGFWFGGIGLQETVTALGALLAKGYGESLYRRAMGALHPNGRAGIEAAIATISATMATTAAESPPPIPIATAIA